MGAGSKVQPVKQRLLRRGCAYGASALVVLALASRAVTGQADDKDAVLEIEYETYGPDNRPFCSDMDIDFPVAGTTGLPKDTFVTTSGDKFLLGCKEFIFAGWNQWEILELASDAPPPFRWTPKCGREHIVSVMNQAVENDLKVMRAWAHTITEGHALQTAPGEYDEKVFEGMDFVMDEARKRGIKIIWAFADNWYPVGGIDQYVEWSPTASSHEDFFTDPTAIKLYKDNIRAIVNRVNSINGIKYGNDPTIMAWNLANEARCQGCGNEPMQNWIEDMCNFVKSVDGNHLVGIGYEGFYGPGSGREKGNPAPWATAEGQNFIENSAVSCIDYAGIHVWPDNWEFVNTEFQKTFIQEHIDDASAGMTKPVVLEEFGKIVEDSSTHSIRNQYFESAFEVAEANVKSGGPLRGTLFWHWYDEGVGPGKYGVRTKHSTFDLIRQHAEFMNEQFETAPSAC